MGINDRGPTGPVLTAAQIAERWGLGVSTVHAMWRFGRMPRPFNDGAAKGFRWALTTIEAYEQQAVGPVYPDDRPAS